MRKNTDLKEWKQSDLQKWIKGKKSSSLQKKKIKTSAKKEQKLAFGYGYNPDILRNGIKQFSYSHDLEDGTKLYEITPKLSYKIFPVLAKILKYKCRGNELRKGNTVIKNRYFTSDQDPEQIIDELNSSIQELFQQFEPMPEYNISKRKNE